MNKRRFSPVYSTLLLLLTLFLASCGGQAAKNEPEPVSDPKLDDTYVQMLVLPVDIGEKFVKDYPRAATDCRDGLIEGLSETKHFQVNLVDAPPTSTVIDRHTLVVKLAITDIRIVSHAARRFGVLAGSSYVNIKMTLTDGHTGQVIRDKEFSTQNSAFAAAWSFGANDDSIPKDMGKIIGDYITAVVPAAL